MKKRIFIRSFFALVIIGIILLVAFSAPIIKSGYDMYKNAINNKSLETAIEEVRNKENYIKIKDISKKFTQEVLKSEDKRFYYHYGFDLLATARAMYNNLKAKSFAQGGSTITQQLAKNIYFSFEKKYERKVAELLVSIDLENMLTKEEILELYCNIAYFGEGCYGVKEAANHYYGVEPNALSNEQISALVFTLKSPNNYNPNVYNIGTVEFKLNCSIFKFDYI